jgi:acetyl esterase/lipase
MKPRIPAAPVIWAAFLSAALAQDTAPHGIPVPAGASVELQQAIRDWPWRALSALPAAPQTDEEWRNVIEASDEQRASTIPQVLERTGTTMRRDRIADVDVHHISPAAVSPENEDRLMLFVHGGAYVFGKGDAGTFEGILVAARVGIPVLSVDYRMPPDDPFPAAVDDVVKVYRTLLETRSPGTIALGGTSAGGGLALAAVHEFRQLGMPVPGAVYAGTPWADLTKTGDTLFTNEVVDRVLVTYDGVLAAAARLYAGDHDLKDPLISPVYGDFTGFPPTILATGTRDLFLSDVARTHRKLREAGIDADLHVYEGLSHAGYLVSPDTPESRDLYREVKAFLDAHLD